jgi:tetratricopeptide (TPR) repeat protein
MDADTQRALEAATQAEDRGALFAALAPVEDRLDQDADVARVWAEALRTSPERPTLLPEAERILRAFLGDHEMLLAVGDALLRKASRRPVDEPPLTPGAAGLAATEADRALDRLDLAARTDPEIGGRVMILRANALSLLGPKRAADADAAFAAALALDGERGPWHFDLGLHHKRHHTRPEAFERMLEATKAARARLGDTRPVLFNLAVAATALGRADEALEAWVAAGLPATRREGSMPFIPDLGPVEVRLPTLGTGHGLGAVVPDEGASFERVWVQPLSPCHGVVRSPTFREARADFGDVILFDPVPLAVRRRGDDVVPTFPLLGVLREGDEQRFRFLALQQEAEQVDALGRALPEGVVLYRHGERVEQLCPRCAAGERYTKHDHLPAETHRVAYGKIVVPGGVELSAFADALADARRAHPGVRMAVPALYEALGRSKEAGTHHKRWGQIEGTVRG